MNAIDIKNLRQKLGITQESLANKIGVTHQTINRWERGAFKPSRLALEKIKQLEEKEE